MELSDLKSFLIDLFGAAKLTDDSEWGFTIEAASKISRLGFATNLTPETVKAAARAEVDLLVTHHDAWDFLYGMKEFCQAELRSHGMSHLFVHLPLDDADFGTGATMVQALGAEVVERTHREGVFHAGVVGEFDHPVDFGVLGKRFSFILEEPILAWRGHDRLISRVSVVTGGGQSTDNVHEAVERDCDVYITGEKVLYTIQYARFAGINLLVGSHTFTEILGVESLAHKIRNAFPGLYVTRIDEEHWESYRR